MIFHIARYKLKPDAPKEDVNAAVAQLHKMGKEIAPVRSYCVGPDIGGEFDLAAVFVLETIEDYETYMRSPIHRKVDEMGLPLLDKMVSFDITDDGDPAVADKIADIHKKRFEGDQGLTDLVTGLSSYSGSSKPS